MSGPTSSTEPEENVIIHSALKLGPRDDAYERAKPMAWLKLAGALDKLPDTPSAPLSGPQSDEKPAAVAEEANSSTGTTAGRADDTAPTDREGN